MRKILFALLLAPLATHAQQGVFTTKSMTPDTALRAARAALEHCSKAGYQVSVAVSDRAGLPQVLLRDRFAGAHTIRIAIDKAWTAASFKLATSVIAKETLPGTPMNGLRNQPRVVAVAGGQPIEASGSLLGAIGVSGAPGGEADDACAAAGIKAIAEAIEF